MSGEACVCCGADIPEGGHVCPLCAGTVDYRELYAKAAKERDELRARLDAERWTPVEERLPARFEIVLLTIPGHERAAEGYIDKHGRWVAGGICHHFDLPPTHWRPLPGIWKEETT